MEAIIIGAGQAGTHLAQILSQEDARVTLIDSNPGRIQQAELELDVRTVCDHVASPQVLERVGVASADLVAAVTQNDELNLIVALTAKQLGARKTAARVFNPAYFEETRIAYRNILGIDLIIAPHILTAFELAKHVEHPAVLAIESFARGAVQLRQMTVREDAKVAGKKVVDAFPPNVHAVLASITRGDQTLVPGADDDILPGDQVTVIAGATRMKKVRYAFKDVDKKPHNIMIAGGGSTAFHLAKLLEKGPFDIRLVDSDRDRCDYLSRELQGITILHGDVTRLQFLHEERVGEVDMYIALCGDDETNLISCLMAKEVGAHECLIQVKRADFLPVIHKTGVDFAVSPRILTANRILTLAGRGHIASVAQIDNGKAEVLELVASRNCKVAGKTLGKDLRLPSGTVIGAIVRGDEVIVPRGGTQVEPGDTVIVFALQGLVQDVQSMFE
jgi:trk system potassium uptake protein TrkA